MANIKIVYTTACLSLRRQHIAQRTCSLTEKKISKIAIIFGSNRKNVYFKVTVDLFVKLAMLLFI